MKKIVQHSNQELLEIFETLHISVQLERARWLDELLDKALHRGGFDIYMAGCELF